GIERIRTAPPDRANKHIRGQRKEKRSRDRAQLQSKGQLRQKPEQELNPDWRRKAPALFAARHGFLSAGAFVARRRRFEKPHRFFVMFLGLDLVSLRRQRPRQSGVSIGGVGLERDEPAEINRRLVPTLLLNRDLAQTDEDFTFLRVELQRLAIVLGRLVEPALAREQSAEIEKCLAVARIDGDGPAKFRERRVEVAAPSEQQTEIVVRVGIAGAYRQRQAIMLDCLRLHSLAREHSGQIV